MIAPELVPSIIGLLSAALWLWLCEYVKKQEPLARLIECSQGHGLYSDAFEKCPVCSGELKP
jgi:hypothetical protein